MGKQGCVTVSCVKTWFLVFTAILLLFGIGLFGLGIYFLVSENDYEPVLGSVTYVTTLGLMIAAGLFSMFVCIFGIVGAIKESRFMVLGFFLMIIIVCLLELVGGILAYVYRKDVESEISRNLNIEMVSNYGLPGNDKKTKAIDQLQKIYQCCGDVDYKVWKKSQWYKENPPPSSAANPDPMKVPDSCCITPDQDKCGQRIHPSNIWRNDLKPIGCINALKNFLVDKLYFIGIACLVAGMAQIICIVLSMWLYRLIVEFR